MNLTHAIQDFLIAEGIPENFRGFTYLAKAIELYKPGMYVVRDLYPVIAEAYDVTTISVERAIRYAANKAAHKRANSTYIAYAKLMVNRKMEVA